MPPNTHERIRTLIRRRRVLAGECWLWPGGSTMWLGGRQRRPARAAYAAFFEADVDALPSIYHVHDCRFSRCVNPAHLYARYPGPESESVSAESPAVRAIARPVRPAPV